jgi:hypothetical protein
MPTGRVFLFQGQKEDNKRRSRAHDSKVSALPQIPYPSVLSITGGMATVTAWGMTG